MRILVLASFTEGTGNKATAERLMTFFAHGGHEAVRGLLDTLETPSDLDALAREESIDLIVGIHAYGSGRLLTGSPPPYVIILSGTDLNECALDPEKLAVMTKVMKGARVAITYSDEFLARAKLLWPHDASRMTCIPKGVVLSPSSFSLKNRMGLCSEDILFLLPAGLRRVKDPLFLRETIDEWHASDPRIHLALVGSIRDEEYAKMVCTMLQKDPCYRYEGLLTPEDLHAAMREAHAVVNTSLSEASANAILEAMALGIPVLARNIPGNASLVRHGETGMLFETPQDFREIAEQLLTQPALRRSLILQAGSFVDQEHSLESERIAYLRLLHRL